MKLNKNLVTMWSRLFETDKSYTEKYGYDVIETDDGGVAIAGYKGGLVGPVDYWIMKLDNMGELH